MATEAELFGLLKEKYPENSHVLLPHVRDTTGSYGTRTADAIAFGLWPSRGLEIEGFEIKCSRNDWIREKDAPEKADAICKYCDRWWLVVADEKIVQSGELPSTWGLMVLKDGKLVAKTLAPKMSPVALDKGFIAALFRQFQKAVTPNCLVQPKINEAFQRGEETTKVQLDYVKKAYQELQKAVQDFENASGVKIDKWDAPRIGEAVRYVLKNGVSTIVGQMRSMKDRLQVMLGNIDSIIAYAEEEQAKGDVPKGMS